uniref:LysR family transcriptional regulator n=1 Tax=Noviherbaspirillum sp. TaxID=1926288 RepID=UPI002FDF4191
MSGFSQFFAFACAARHGSFARAGRELGVTPSTVAKRIVRLEEQLGIKLFHRTTRQVSLTSDGEALFARCEKILADIDELEALAAGTGGEPRGELRINAPIAYGKRMVLPVVADLLLRHPGMTADVRLTDQVCDLIKDGMDAAIRIMPLEDSRLASRQIGVQ